MFLNYQLPRTQPTSPPAPPLTPTGPALTPAPDNTERSEAWMGTRHHCMEFYHEADLETLSDNNPNALSGTEDALGLADESDTPQP